MTGMRSDSRLLHVLCENQLYRVNTKTKKTTVYKCRISKCLSRVYLDSSNTCRRVVNFKEHNHGDCEAFIKGVQFKNVIKHACMTATTTSEKKKSTREIFVDHFKQ